MRIICLFSLCILAITFACGCENPNQAARGAGQPIGGILSIPQSITEGVAEGYAGGDRGPNPYGR
ncbi:MAG: hypothetical protein RBU23_03265 [Candidatus Auribacterota bacterium]|jgi:hypothetical protein|nr:hypothetical protein [Candidatus Auribacterota bacterium]